MSYRKIWEQAYGKIPVDSSGRKMEIHHIDGNRNNNELSNLKLVTIQEHYDIHYQQGDWAACQSIANRMLISPEEKSRICSELAKKRLNEGTHHFTDPAFILKDSERKSLTRSGKNHPLFGKQVSKITRAKRSSSHKKLVEKGEHHLQSAIHKKRMSERARTQIAAGAHPFQQPDNIKRHVELQKKLAAEKVHPFNRPGRTDPNKLMVWCNHCEKEISKPMFGRYHKHEDK